jgi:uncharacterized protein (DUF302 family)
MAAVEYAFTRSFSGRTHADLVAKAREELAKEGFGVLTEIDVQATFLKKLGIERRPYLILGACNPKLAHQALATEPSIGVLLPCNVDVYEADDGTLTVETVNPRKLFDLVGRPEVRPIAEEVASRLQRVLAAL